MRIEENKVFVGQIVHLDETRFVRCEFQNCTLIWTGEDTGLNQTQIDQNCTFVFQGRAAKIIRVLKALGAIRADVENFKLDDGIAN